MHNSVKQVSKCSTFFGMVHANIYWTKSFFLTWSSKEEKHCDPVDPEQHQAQERPERLQGQQGKVDEHFTRHMEQWDGESNTLPHDEHYNQENHLEDQTSICDPMKPFNCATGLNLESITDNFTKKGNIAVKENKGTVQSVLMYIQNSATFLCSCAL